MSNRKIKISLVGIGAITNKHIEAIKYFNKDIELISICDTNEETLTSKVDEYGVEGFLDLDKLLSSSNPDFIVLCTPNGLHYTQAMQCAKSGFNVITEKPMSLNLTDAKSMIKTFSDLNLKLFVVKQVRLLKRIKLIRQAIEENHFGKIYLSNFNLFWSRPQSFYDETNWRGTLKLDGGTLYNQAIHYIDLMVWLFGEASTINCFSSTLGREIEVEDTAVINIDFKNGAKGSINATTLTYPKNLECSFTIIGERGTIKIGGPALDKIENWEFQDNFAQEDIYKDKEGFNHKNFYEGIIKDFNGVEQLKLTGEDALQTIRVIEAALESSTKGKQIFL